MRTRFNSSGTASACCSDDPSLEANRVARQIHEQWPFIPEDEALKFYRTLYGISSAEGAVRVSLWVLARVIEHKLTK